MPPAAKITKEMIIDAGFEIARQCGIEYVNARTVSEKLGCSTQPVMYHLKKIEDLKRAVYQKADEYHTAYITDIQGGNPMRRRSVFFLPLFSTDPKAFCPACFVAVVLTIVSVLYAVWIIKQPNTNGGTENSI